MIKKTNQQRQQQQKKNSFNIIIKKNNPAIQHTPIGTQRAAIEGHKRAEH